MSAHIARSMLRWSTLLLAAVLLATFLVHVTSTDSQPGNSPKGGLSETRDASIDVEQITYLSNVVYSSNATSPASGDSWPMLAANPQRTSWTPEEVRGNLAVDWYRPIEPYIPYKIQPIAENGKIYVSTARGLYAFNATNGNIDWVYPTELPLGHSPTIATVNGTSTAYVGGYDRQIHALNALTGQPIPGYTPYQAGAGFETNPLVIDNVVYAGNRDGAFYAFDAVSGALRWKFQTDGPILFSAAYKDSVLYFASNDAYAYALSANKGDLVWKSGKFPGQGFHSFWPVIFTDKSKGQDYVIVTTGENHRQSEGFSLTTEETHALYANFPTSATSPTLPTTNPLVSGDWFPGTVTMDASPILKYLESNPKRRTVFVIDASTGQEYAFTDPATGKQTYAPFTWSGVTHSGSKYPPVVNGIDGILYQQTAYSDYHGWVSKGAAVGWKFGTPFISKIAQEIGGPDTTASDEPAAYSSGGRLIYWVLCCDRSAGAYDISIPFGQPNRAEQLWGYDMARNDKAPGYQLMYDDGDSNLYGNMDGWQIYSGKNSSKNGVYGKHGTTQSPPIPYQGKLYTLKGNALLAFSPAGTNAKTPLALATIVPAQNSLAVVSSGEVQNRLESEVRKILAAGHLRAGYSPAGFLENVPDFGEIFDYFQNPSDTVVTLLQTLPYLPPDLQSEVKTYVQSNYGPGASYDFTRIAHIGFGTGAQREAFDTPPEAYFPTNPDGIGGPYRSPLNPSERPTCGGDPANGYACGYWFRFPPFNFYAAWRYAQVFGGAKAIFDGMKTKIEEFPGSDSPRRPYLARRPYLLHLYIAGYQGYLELEKMAGYPQDANVYSWYNQALNLRMNGFAKDTPFSGGPNVSVADYYQRSLSVARNFMFLTPEIADYMNVHLKSQVQEAIDEYSYVAPYWFVSGFDSSVGEGTFQSLYDYPSLFQAKAYILKQPYNELAKYLDAPGLYQGDLFYLQNLVAALAAAETDPNPDPTPNPTPDPIPDLLFKILMPNVQR